jgi:hypothetical protein
MGTEGALLGEIQFLVPGYRTVGTGINHLRLPFSLDRVDNNDTIRSFIYGSIGSSFDTGGIITVLARLGQVTNIDNGILSPFISMDVYPFLLVRRLGSRVSLPAVIYILVLAGQVAVITVFTLFDVDYPEPSFHSGLFTPPTSLSALNRN